MRTELKSVLQSIEDLPAEEVPRLLGELEEIRATALMRLSMPAPHKPSDQLLDVDQAAERLGMSRDYVYRHADEFPFTRRQGRALRFSANGIDRWMAKR